MTPVENSHLDSDFFTCGAGRRQGQHEPGHDGSLGRDFQQHALIRLVFAMSKKIELTAGG